MCLIHTIKSAGRLVADLKPGNEKAAGTDGDVFSRLDINTLQSLQTISCAGGRSAATFRLNVI